ncbi:MAG TPA: hypothetical protein VM884_07890 [Flavisolibacter sp.]|nr:hypothetical protein [Flavisolibacter sp.]
MSPKQLIIIRNSWYFISNINEGIFGKFFYERLNIIAPEMRSVFQESLPYSSKKMMTMIGYAVRNIEHPEEIGYTFSHLASRYGIYVVKSLKYAVANAFLWALEQSLGGLWTDDIEDAWAAFYTAALEYIIPVTDRQQIAA